MWSGDTLVPNKYPKSKNDVIAQGGLILPATNAYDKSKIIM